MARTVPGYAKGSRARDTSAYKYRKSPRSKTGEGYETDRSDSEYRFEVEIKYAKMEDKLSEVRREFKSFSKGVADIFDSKSSASKSGLGFISLGTRSRRDSDYQSDSALIEMLDVANIRDDVYKYLAPDIGLIGVGDIRAGIRRPATPPKWFRYETGDMYNSVTYRKRNTKNSTIISIGWVRNFYKYFDFQESGTSGVGPMYAISRGFRSTTPKAYKLVSRFLNNYAKSSGFGGRYSR